MHNCRISSPLVWKVLKMSHNDTLFCHVFHYHHFFLIRCKGNQSSTNDGKIRMTKIKRYLDCLKNQRCTVIFQSRSLIKGVECKLAWYWTLKEYVNAMICQAYSYHRISRDCLAWHTLHAGEALLSQWERHFHSAVLLYLLCHRHKPKYYGEELLLYSTLLCRVLLALHTGANSQYTVLYCPQSQTEKSVL